MRNAMVRGGGTLAPRAVRFLEDMTPKDGAFSRFQLARVGSCAEGTAAVGACNPQGGPVLAREGQVSSEIRMYQQVPPCDGTC